MRLAILLALAGCVDEVDARWELDHDHVIAVRATPPRIAAGERATLDALVAHAGRPVAIESAASVTAPTAPAELQGMIAHADGAWVVTAPSSDTLATTRPVMGLAPDAPIPLDLLLVYPRAGGDPLYVTKTIWLGEHADNPPPPDVLVDGAPAAAELAVPVGRDVYVEVPTPARVNWLTSVGTLFQDDVARAFLRVESQESGEFAVVVRATDGGVTWRIWPIAAH